jgi:malonate-semialdehyde dehydrogenase (acetylating)/methylmalonate-semialdehyde dehydrogenase
MLGLVRLNRFRFAQIYPNFIDGEFVQSKSNKFFDVRNPVTQDLVGQTPQSTKEELDHAVARAQEAFKTWSRVPLTSIFC